MKSRSIQGYKVKRKDYSLKGMNKNDLEPHHLRGWAK